MAGQYRFKDINGNIVAQISASAQGAISFSGSAVDFSNASTITLGEVQLAGTASNALLLDGFDSTAFVFTSSFNTISQSISSQLTTLQTTSGSNIGRLNNLESKSSSVDISISNINNVTSSFSPRVSNLESKSASVDISISNINSVTASNIARLSNLESKSASVDISITNINSVTASNIARLTNLETKSSSVDISVSSINTFTSSNGNTSLNSKTGSYATTGSNTFFGTQTFSGSVYIANDLIVQGSSSIQYISASSVSIGTNIVQLNTANPSVRFAGLTMIDSGSVGGSGSFLYDSLQDEFIFVHRGNGTNVTSSHFVTGPETYDSLGNETYLTCNIITKGTGKEHLVDSCIFDNGTTTCIKNNLVIGGTTCFQNNVAITGFLSFNVGASASNFAARDNCDTLIYSNTGKLKFTDVTGTSNYMTISSSGNIGIGTTSPAKTLHVVNTDYQLRLSYDTSGVYTDFRNDSAGGLLVNTSGPYIVNYINGSAKMRIDADAICFSTTICSPTIISSGTICSIGNTCFGGNTIINGCVGMGTATPTAKLHVYCAADVWHTRIGGACGELRIGGDTASGAVIQSYTPAGVVRDLYIQRDGGNIGIGTNCALSKVHIYASCANGAATPNANTLLLIDSNNHQLIEMRTCSASYGAMQGIAFTDNGLNAFVGYKEYTCQTAGTYGEAMHLAFYDYSASDPNNGIYFGTSTTPNCGVSKPLMFIKGNGCVGIGTCTPESTLHINGTNSGGYGASLTITNVGTAANTATGIDFGVDASTAGGGVGNAQIKVVNIGGASGANCSDMIFTTWDGSTFNERLRIKDKRNILIDTGNNASQLSTATPSALRFNNDYSNGYTDASLKLYLFNSGTTIHGFTSGPSYDIQYHSSGDNVNAKHVFYTNCSSKLSIHPTSICVSVPIINTSNYKAHTYCQLTSPIAWCASVTGNTFTSFSTTGLGLPSGVRALQVLGWYHINGYSIGTAGQGDHAVSLFGITTDSAISWGGGGSGWPGGNSSFQNTNWGSFVLWHDGDSSQGTGGNIQYYGMMDSGVVSVHSNGNVYANLAHGLSGGTHYISLQIQGFWI